MENWNMEHKIVKHIDCPHDWVGEDDYSSHKQMLWLALTNTNGNVQEFGSGKGSTPLFKSGCHKQKRVFHSYENDEHYAIKYPDVVVKISNYMDVYLHKPSLLFIDSAPGEQRKDLVILHKNNAEVIVLHDTEPGAQSIYGITEVLNSFKYRLDYYPEGMPGTTALSNFVDVTKWVD